MFKRRYWVIIVLILGGGAAFLAYNSGGNELTVDCPFAIAPVKTSFTPLRYIDRSRLIALYIKNR